MQKTFAILFSILTIFSCNPKGSNQTDNATTLPAINKAEPIMGIQMNGDSSSITLSVASNGCTQKADFTCTVTNDTLVLTRLKPDNCKRMPFLTKFTWSFKEAGITPGKSFFVKNPFEGNLMLE